MLFGESNKGTAVESGIFNKKSIKFVQFVEK